MDGSRSFKAKEILKARKKRKDLYRERAERDKKQQNDGQKQHDSSQEQQNNDQGQQGDTKISPAKVAVEMVRSFFPRRNQETVLEEGRKKTKAVEIFDKTYQTLEVVTLLLTSFKENLDLLLIAQEQTEYSLEQLNETVKENRPKLLDKVKELDFSYKANMSQQSTEEINANNQSIEKKIIDEQQKVEKFLEDQLGTLKEKRKQLLKASHGNNSLEKANSMNEDINRINKSVKELAYISNKLDEKGYLSIKDMDLEKIQEILEKEIPGAINDAIDKRPALIKDLVSKLREASTSFYNVLEQHKVDLGGMFSKEDEQKEFKDILENAKQHYEKIQKQVNKHIKEQINNQKPLKLYKQIKEEFEREKKLKMFIEIEGVKKIENAINGLKEQIATPQCDLKDCCARLEEYKNDMETRKTTIENIRQEYKTNVKDMLDLVKSNISIDPEEHWKTKIDPELAKDAIQIKDIRIVKSADQAIESLEQEIQKKEALKEKAEQQQFTKKWSKLRKIFTEFNGMEKKHEDIKASFEAWHRAQSQPLEGGSPPETFLKWYKGVKVGEWKKTIEGIEKSREDVRGGLVALANHPQADQDSKKEIQEMLAYVKNDTNFEAVQEKYKPLLDEIDGQNDGVVQKLIGLEEVVTMASDKLSRNQLKKARSLLESEEVLSFQLQQETENLWKELDSFCEQIAGQDLTKITRKLEETLDDKDYKNSKEVKKLKSHCDQFKDFLKKGKEVRTGDLSKSLLPLYDSCHDYLIRLDRDINADNEMIPETETLKQDWEKLTLLSQHYRIEEEPILKDLVESCKNLVKWRKETIEKFGKEKYISLKIENTYKIMQKNQEDLIKLKNSIK